MFNNLDYNFCKILKKAEHYRSLFSHEYVGTEHLMLAIFEKKKLDKFLKPFNINFNILYDEVKNCINSSTVFYPNCYTPLLKKIINKCEEQKNFSDKNILFNILDEGEGVGIRLLSNLNVDIDKIYNSLVYSNKECTNLSIYKYGKNLGNYININERVIGRDKEIELLIETLLRKKKSNPLLIGNPGVGKTAIVEEFSRRIMLGNVPEQLLNMKVIMLDMSTLISGTRYRGEFEEKLNAIIDDLLNNKDIIIFIDEIHTIVNAGAAEGAISAADILKPYLARGDIRCIGATTQDEYEKYFKKDGALSRRFEPIYVNEPSLDETYNILKKIKSEYELFHNVSISDDNLRILIECANKYFPNQKNPDKSLELLDSVLSYVKMKKDNNKLENIQLLLKKCEIKKIKNIEEGNFKQALKVNWELKNLREKIINTKNCYNRSASKEDIFDILEFKNNIIINKKVNKKEIKRNIIKHIQNQYKPLLFISNDSVENIKKIGKNLNYKSVLLNKSVDISKIIKTVKFCPSTLIVCNNINNYDINQFLKKITKEYLIEYNDEYVSFNNVIIFVQEKHNNFGFNKSNNYEFNVDCVLN